MGFRARARRPGAWLLAVVLACMGCSRSVSVAERLKLSEDYYSRGQYSAAAIESRNLLRQEPTHAAALRILGLSLYQLEQFEQAFTYLDMARTANPHDRPVRLALAWLYVRGGKPKEAWDEALCVLDMEPQDHDGLLVLASSALDPGKVDTALSLLVRAIPTYDHVPEIYLATGSLHLRRQEVEAAEGAYRSALAVAPRSVETHLALAELLIAKGANDEGEAALQAAIKLAPGRAEAPVRLAEFYLQTGRPDQARRTLNEALATVPDDLEALTLLARLLASEGKYAEAEKHIDSILARNPLEITGLLLRGEVELENRHPDKAVAALEKLLALAPRQVAGLFLMARAHTAMGDFARAKSRLQEALSLAPTFPQAMLLLAELNVATKDPVPALTDLNRLIASGYPDPRCYRLLGTALRMTGKLPQAVEAHQNYVRLMPKDAEGPHELGLDFLAMGRVDEARKQFESALALAPDNVEPLVQLVGLLRAEKNHAKAIELALAAAERNPRSALHQCLLGDVYVAAGNAERADNAYARAIEILPGLRRAHLLRADLALKTGKVDQAIGRLEEALVQAPEDQDLMLLLAVMHRRQADNAGAAAVYERMLKLDPKNVAALNNSALLHAERGDSAKARTLADKARDAAPDDPRVLDTYGWILYNESAYQPAAAALLESAGKLPDNPEVLYHLGMTQFKLGQLRDASKTLAKALSLSGDFLGADEARRALRQME